MTETWNMPWRDNGHVLQHSIFCVVRCIHIQLKVIAMCTFCLTTLEHHCYPIHSFNGLSFLTLRDSSIPDESEVLVLECFVWSQTAYLAFHVPCCPVLQSVTANIPVAYYLQFVTWTQEVVQNYPEEAGLLLPFLVYSRIIIFGSRDGWLRPEN